MKFASAHNGRKAACPRAGQVPPPPVAALPIPRASAFDVSKLFGDLHQELARLAALDLVESLHDADRTRGLHEAEDALRAAGGLARCIAARAAAEEERDRHFERLGNALQAACADTIHTFLVLLNLLEGDPNPVGKLSLRKAAFQPPGAYAAPDFRITVVSASRAHVLI